MKISCTPRRGLLDSNAMIGAWYTGDRPRSTDELADTPDSYVLLAPGGAGKTTAVDDLRSREADIPGAQFLECCLQVSRSGRAQVLRRLNGVGDNALKFFDEILQLPRSSMLMMPQNKGL